MGKINNNPTFSSLLLLYCTLSDFPTFGRESSFVMRNATPLVSLPSRHAPCNSIADLSFERCEEER